MDGDTIAQRVLAAAATDPCYQQIRDHLRAEVYVVGGAVRDAALALPPADLDLVVACTPDELFDWLIDSPAIGPIVHYPSQTRRLRVAGNFQHHLDICPMSIRCGELIEFDARATPEQMLAERNYSVNAMAVHLSDSAFFDPYGALADLAQGTVRHLRRQLNGQDVLRALNLSARFGLRWHPDTAVAIEAARDQVSELLDFVFEMELDKLEQGTHLSLALDLAERHHIDEVAGHLRWLLKREELFASL